MSHRQEQLAQSSSSSSLQQQHHPISSSTSAQNKHNSISSMRIIPQNSILRSSNSNNHHRNSNNTDHSDHVTVVNGAAINISNSSNSNHSRSIPYSSERTHSTRFPDEYDPEQASSVSSSSNHNNRSNNNNNHHYHQHHDSNHNNDSSNADAAATTTMTTRLSHRNMTTFLEGTSSGGNTNAAANVVNNNGGDHDEDDDRGRTAPFAATALSFTSVASSADHSKPNSIRFSEQARQLPPSSSTSLPSGLHHYSNNNNNNSMRSNSNGGLRNLTSGAAYHNQHCTWQQGQRQRKRKFYCYVSFAILLLLCAVAGGITALRVVRKNNNNDSEKSSSSGDGSPSSSSSGGSGDNDGNGPPDNMPSDPLVPSSKFENSESVQWTIASTLQVLPLSAVEDNTKDSNQHEENSLTDNNSNVTRTTANADEIAAIAVSADGRRVVIGSQQGVIQVFHQIRLDTESDAWTPVATFTDPTTDDVDSIYGQSLALSGNGMRLAAGTGKRVITYNWENATQMWKQHIQPITEYQAEDGTGMSVGLNFDGSILFVGAPWHDATALSTGQVRFYKWQSVAWSLVAYERGSGLGHQVGGSGLVLSADGTTALDGNANAHGPAGFGSGLAWIWQYPQGSGRLPQDDDKAVWPLADTFEGPASYAGLGESVAVSARGRTAAVSSPGYRGGAVFVYEREQEGVKSPSWQPRGAPVGVPTGEDTGICLAADGNILVMATRSAARVTQYQPSRTTSSNAAGTEFYEWGIVGSFVGANNSNGDASSSFGHYVACSADAHRLFLGQDNLVTIWKAVEQ